MDSIQRVQRSFSTKEDNQSLLDILFSQFTTTFSSLTYTLPSEFSKFEYPQNLCIYPINLSPNTTQLIHFDVVTSILRLNFYLVQGFPPMRKYIVDQWLSPQLTALKAQFVTFVKQRASMYEDNQFIMKNTNVALSNYGSLVLDSHFLMYGPADDSCKTHPDEKLNFFLFLAFASTSLNVYYESVRRICHASYPKVQHEACKATDNTADWFFNALEREYLRHGVEKVDIVASSRSSPHVSLDNMGPSPKSPYLLPRRNISKSTRENVLIRQSSLAGSLAFDMVGPSGEHNASKKKRKVALDDAPSSHPDHDLHQEEKQRNELDLDFYQSLLSSEMPRSDSYCDVTRIHE